MTAIIGITGIGQKPGGIQDAGHVNTDADSIDALLRAKSKDGEGREVSQREFDKIMEQGYTIVTPYFASRPKHSGVFLTASRSLRTCNTTSICRCAAIRYVPR